jgi:hypothetical protein
LLEFGASLYRAIEPGEPIGKYRDAIANLHANKDPVEAHEIRTGKGWDDLDVDLLLELSPSAVRIPAVISKLASRLRRMQPTGIK